MKAPDAHSLIIKFQLLLSGAIPIMATYVIDRVVALGRLGIDAPTLSRSSLVVAVFVLIGIFYLVVFNCRWLNGERMASNFPLVIDTVKTKNIEAIGYLAANSFALKILDYQNISQLDVISTVIAIVLFSVIYIKLDLSELNPTMYIMGYRSYEVTLRLATLEKAEGPEQKSKTFTLITKRKNIAPGDKISAIQVNNYLYLDQG